MKNWEKYYEENTTSVQEAIKRVGPEQKILFAALSNEPQAFAEELVAQRGRLYNVTIYNMVQGSPCLYAQPNCTPHFKIRTFLSSPALMYMIEQGDFDYIPINLSNIPKWLSHQEIDHVFIQVTPPNLDGYCSLGISVDYMKAAIHHGKRIVAQVNENLPWTYGETKIHVSDIDAFVLSNTPLIEILKKPITEIERMIGGHVASLIPDRATIQIGIGGIAEGVLDSLRVKKDLGVHTGTFSDGLIDLIELGVVTNEYKTMNRGKVVSTSIAGTKKIYNYVDKNHLFELYPVEYTHSIRTLSQIDYFYSINSALEVDLTGQVNAEKLNSLQIAGVGGQMDFIKGAQASKGGKSIIALPSSAKNNTLSKIVLQVNHITSLRTEIDYVVTEYGIASLAGKTLKERANELISIAHPNFREELRKAYCHMPTLRKG